MATTTIVYNRTHSVTYVSDYILKNLQRLITGLGLDVGPFVNRYSTFEQGIKTWLKSGHLEEATLEIYDPSTNSLVGRFDFSISYDWISGETAYWVDEDQIVMALRKAKINASNAKWDIILSTKPGSPNVSGWSSCSYRSTSGMVRQSLGSAIEHNGLGSSLSYWRNA